MDVSDSTQSVIADEIQDIVKRRTGSNDIKLDLAVSVIVCVYMCVCVCMCVCEEESVCV